MNNKAFKPEVRNILYMIGACVATEIVAAFPVNRKWAAIYPIKGEDDKILNVRYFEVELPRKIVDEGLDWFQSDEISFEKSPLNEQELYKFLSDNNIDPSNFDSPWKCDYPYHY